MMAMLMVVEIAVKRPGPLRGNGVWLRVKCAPSRTWRLSPMAETPAEPVATNRAFSFVAMEHDVLALWDRHDVFRQSLDATKDKQPYIFYDGPPFATGLPHHGNLLASIIKDIVPRYWTMRGRHVLRRFGWDCHGLPVEHEIDKQLGMSAQQAVRELGVAGYNAECRKIVERYVDEWRAIIGRIGRWVDFDDDYKTMDPWYMESVWWVVKQLWDKGLVYRGFKVMPVSVALQTPLSNFEANMNYREVRDPAITVLFKLADEDAYLTAWTTTPWTLPSNLAVCVGADIDYARVRDAATGRILYLARRARRGLCEAPRARGARRGPGRGPGGARLRAAVPLLPRCGGAGRVRRGRGRLRHHRRGHRPRPPGAGVRRGRLPRAARARHRGIRLSRGHGRRVRPGGNRLRRAVRQGRRCGHHGLPEEIRHPVRPRRHRTRLSLLLPLGHAPYLPGRALVVRARDGPHRRPRVGQRRDPLGAGAHEGRSLRQLAQGGRGLGHLAQPGVGHAVAHLGERRYRQPALHRVHRRARASYRTAHRGSTPRVRRSAHLRNRGGGGHLSPGGGSARLLVRVRFHALRPAPLPLREPAGLRAGVPGGIHRGGPRSDPGLVLHADGPGGGALRPAGVPQRHRQRPGDGRGRQEDVQEPAQLHAAGRTHGNPRRGRPAALPDQLRAGAGRGSALRRPGRARHGAPGAPALVQRLRLPADLCPHRRLGAGPGVPPRREHPGPVGALEAPNHEGGNRPGDGGATASTTWCPGSSNSSRT